MFKIGFRELRVPMTPEKSKDLEELRVVSEGVDLMLVAFAFFLANLGFIGEKLKGMPFFKRSIVLGRVLDIIKALAS